VDKLTGDPLRALNELYPPHRQTLATAFGMT